MRPSVEADWLTSGGDTGAMCGPVHGARRRTGYAANADLSDVVLNETQRAGLRWIADGWPDGVMEARAPHFGIGAALPGPGPDQGRGPTWQPRSRSTGGPSCEAPRPDERSRATPAALTSVPARRATRPAAPPRWRRPARDERHSRRSIWSLTCSTGASARGCTRTGRRGRRGGRPIPYVASRPWTSPCPTPRRPPTIARSRTEPRAAPRRWGRSSPHGSPSATQGHAASSNPGRSAGRRGCAPTGGDPPADRQRGGRGRVAALHARATVKATCRGCSPSSSSTTACRSRCSRTTPTSRRAERPRRVSRSPSAAPGPRPATRGARCRRGASSRPGCAR
jgi:hypothetical protein